MQRHSQSWKLGGRVTPAMKWLSLRIEEGFVTEMMCLRRGLAAAHGAHERVAICLSANAGEIKPIERLVRLSFTRCRASTRLLSTGWSVPALGECWF